MPDRLTRDADGDPRYYTAQWNDDIHHVLHVAATGESNGYYAAYRATPSSWAERSPKASPIRAR